MRALRWTDHAVAQLEAVADHVSISSPVYAEQLVDRITRRLNHSCEFPESGRVVPEFARPEIPELEDARFARDYQIRSQLNFRRQAATEIAMMEVLSGIATDMATYGWTVRVTAASLVTTP